MTSIEERREVAARLRDNDHGYYTECDFFLHALGMPRHVLIPYDWAKVHDRLADLIDPTCQMKSIPKSSYRVCSRCGAFVRRDAVTSCTEVIPVRHCPNCGARVVEG